MYQKARNIKEKKVFTKKQEYNQTFKMNHWSQNKKILVLIFFFSN